MNKYMLLLFAQKKISLSALNRQYSKEQKIKNMMQKISNNNQLKSIAN